MGSRSNSEETGTRFLQGVFQECCGLFSGPAMRSPLSDRAPRDEVLWWHFHLVVPLCPLAEAAGPHCVHVHRGWCRFPPLSQHLFLCIWECCWEVSREKLGPCFQCNAELYRLTRTSRKHWQDSRHPQEAKPIRKHWCHWQTKQMSTGKTNCFPMLLIFP